MKNVRFNASDWYKTVIDCFPTEFYPDGEMRFLGFPILHWGDWICILVKCDYCDTEYPTKPFCSQCGAHHTGQKFTEVHNLNEAIDTIWSK